MGVTDFDTKVAVVVRDDLATWQRLNVTAFLMSGIVAAAGTTAIGEPYRDADAREYLPLLVQPVLVFIASGDRLRALRERAERRQVPVAVYTAEMFSTGNDADNRGSCDGQHDLAAPARLEAARERLACGHEREDVDGRGQQFAAIHQPRDRAELVGIGLDGEVDASTGRVLRH